MSAPTVVSTFAGAGGSSLGYKQAGFECRLAVEWDANAAATYALNFPKTTLFHGDIASLSVDAALEMARLLPGELDVFDGSPPCQGFSTAGSRNRDDPRNQLFRQYIRLLRGFNPRAMVMENVVGMVIGSMKPAFVDICAELTDAGYVVAARTLLASQHGTPQRRPRVIVVGVRKDIAARPSHPNPSTMPISCEVATSGLAGEPTHESQRAWLLVACAGLSSFEHYDRMPSGSLQSRAMGTPGKGFTNRRQHPRKPSYTISKTDSNLGLSGQMHWAEKRRLTIPEAKRLSGFPDDFRFDGEWSDAMQMIGNCVPPPLMRAVASHVRSTILDAT